MTILCDKFTGHPKGYVAFPTRVALGQLPAPQLVLTTTQIRLRRVCRPIIGGLGHATE